MLLWLYFVSFILLPTRGSSATGRFPSSPGGPRRTSAMCPSPWQRCCPTCHGQNAAEMAALVEGKRLGMHACIGPASWDHRPLVTVLIGHVVMRLASSHGIDADRRGVLERGHPLGAAVDAGLDTTTRALGVERPAEAGVLHAQPPLSGATGSAHAGATRWPAWTSILPVTACHQGSDGVPYSRSKKRDG